MALDKLIATLNKAYDRQVIYAASTVPEVFKVPTGNPAFDYVCNGGVPVNRITEFIGPEASLKTYHAYLSAIAFQKIDWNTMQQDAIRHITWDTKNGFSSVSSVAAARGVKSPKVKRVALIDTEGTFDPDWAAKVGVDVEGLLYVVPESLSQAVDVAESLIKDPDVCLVIFDSMSAVGADAEMDESMDKDQMGINARFWNRSIRKFQNAMNANPEKHVSVIVINTFTTKIGFVMGNPNTPRNGNQLKYAKACSVEFRALKVLEATEEGGTGGRNFSVHNLKSKIGRPFRSANFFFSYETSPTVKKDSVDSVGALVDLAIRFDLVKRSGAWYEYGTLKVHGAEKFKVTIFSDLAQYSKLKAETYGRFEDNATKV